MILYDETLLNFAKRIKGRAIRWCGELLREIRPKRTGRPTKSRGVPPLIFVPARRPLIESYYPSAKRIELFARFPSPGWAVWGNEVESPAGFD